MSIPPANPADARTAVPADARTPKPATAATQAAQAAVAAALPFSDRQSFADAQRGLLARRSPMSIPHSNGTRTVLDLETLSFLDGAAPDTVNPSLWRQAQLNALHHGLYEVVDGIYQVRGFDLANMTLIRGETGWIVIDPLTASETSAAALALANEHLGERPVRAVIYTHSHADHFAGVLGVVTPAEAASGKVAVIAPEHFVTEALSENVLAGNVMGRRATYMYGNLLPHSPTGFVSTGLGAALAMGTTGFVVPNDVIRETGESRDIDGVRFIFQMTPGTEAPAEFVFYLPDFKALCMSEITSHHLHNLYTPRGAPVRDALAWAEQINESIDRFGGDLDVQFACHHWPTWGRAAVNEYLTKQRDLYKFIHDQTLRLANHGYAMDEIAEQVSLPASLSQSFSNRDYYGTVRHNSKAVYVKYLGYFDGNPVTLNAHPRTTVAPRYVEAMGGANAVGERATAAFAAGDYRWSAELLNHVVMADPGDLGARAALADSLEQLGYQAESGPWRNFYLCGALELRQGLPEGRALGVAAGMAAGMPLPHVFQTLAVRLNAERADGLVLRLNLSIGQPGDADAEQWLLSVEHSVLNAFPDRHHQAPDATLSANEAQLKSVLLGAADPADLIAAGVLACDGDQNALPRLLALFDAFVRRFPIVTPRPKSPSA